MFAQKFLRSFAFGCIFVAGLSLAIPSLSNAQKYRVILPPRPQQPPALNNTVQSQIANQNVGFNTQSQVNGFGGGGIGQGGGGFQANSGGLQGTGQVTQNNAPGSQLSFLYQLPTATQFQPGGGGFGQAGGGGGFGQGAGGQGAGGFGQNAGGGGFGQGGGGGGFGQGGGGFGGGGSSFGQGGGGGGFGQGGGTGGQAIGMDNPFYQMAMQGIMSGVGGSAFQSGGGGNMGGGGFGQQGGGQFGGGQFGGGQFGGGGFGQGGGQFGGGQFGGGGQGGGGQAIDPNIAKNNANLQKQLDLQNKINAAKKK